MSYVERHHWMRRDPLPPNPDGNAQHSNNKWRDDLDLAPSWIVTSGQSERHKYETENADSENDADDVELPEQCLNNLPASVLLNRCLVVLESTCSLRLVIDPPQ